MNDGAPYRARCLDYPPCTLGTPFQHGRADTLTLPNFTLSATVNGSAVTLAPLNTAESSGCDDGTGCYANGYGPPPYPQFDGTNYLTPPGVNGPWNNTSNTGNVFPVQTYTAAGTGSGPGCNLTGYKSVIAARQWHGAFGWLTPDGCVSVLCQSTDSCPGNSYSPAVLTPDQTKYLTVTVSINFSSSGNFDDAPSIIQTASGGYTNTVDANSGTVTSSNDFTQYASQGAGYEWDFEQDVETVPYCTTDIPNCSDVTGGELAPEHSWIMFMAITGYTSEIVMPSSFVYTQSTSGWSWTNTNTTVVGTIYGSIEIVRTNTNYSWEIHWTWTTADGILRATMDYTGSIVLSSVNTGDSVLADAETNLLATWDLLDHALYPPTTNSWKGVAPFVTRNEVGGPVSPIGVDYSEEPDPNIAVLTADGTALGAIIGAPLTISGQTEFLVDDYYQWRYQDWITCCNELPPGWYRNGYGGLRSAAPAYLPSRCTQWTNLLQATSALDALTGLPIGRFRLAGGTIYVSKWWESAVRLPSFNHARPFGTDRYLIDETCVGCMTLFDSLVVTLSNSVTVADGDTMVVYGTGDGGSGGDGIYTVTEGYGTDVTTFTLAYVGPLPDGFSYWDSNSSNDGICARLRFPTCAPFAGRVAVSSVTDNGDGTVTVATDTIPVAYDAAWPIDLLDFNMNPLATDLTPASGATTNSVTVTATYATVAGAKWLTLYGALPSDTPQTGVAHWYWNDTAGKGNYVLAEWLLDRRTKQETARLAGQYDCNCDAVTIPTPDPNPNYGYKYCYLTDECKGWVACSPWQIVLSPNSSDTPASGTGVRFDFSETPLIDQKYGTVQQLDVIQASYDYLYQTPHTACDESSTPPTCIPLVESRAILPAASSMTTPPDNGTGWAQDEGPPPGCIDYTMHNPATTTGEPFTPTPPFCIIDPASGNPGINATQPVQNAVPGGIFTPCS